MKIFGIPLKIKWWGTVIGTLVFAAVCVAAVNFSFTQEETRSKVGFIILGDINEPGWNASHYQGVKSACEEFGMELLVRDNVPEYSGECPKAVRELAGKGCEIIFLMSFGYASEVQNIVDELPRVAFTTSSAEVHRPNMTSYFARMYQGRYLAGALAGMKTKSGVIGYVAAFPNNTEVNRGINAFTLGTRRTNPNARVVVAWTGAWLDAEKEAENARRLIDEAGADVLTYHQDDRTVADIAESCGVDFIGYNMRLSGYSEHHLTDVFCHWEIYYKDILRRYMKGELNAVKNHWIGIERGAVALGDYSPAVTAEMEAKLAALRQELANNRMIFIGPLYDNHGNLRCGEGEVIPDDTLLECVDWQIRGVEILE